jgi:hypothetical protein
MRRILTGCLFVILPLLLVLEGPRLAQAALATAERVTGGTLAEHARSSVSLTTGVHLPRR